MKKLFLIVSLGTLFAGCGGSDVTPPMLATGPQVQNAPTPSPTPTVPERILAGVEFQVGSYSYVAIRWLEAKGIIFKPQDANPIPTDVDLANSIRVYFPIPSVMSTPDSSLVRAKYGCSDPRRGDIYYYDGTLSDAKVTLSQGNPVFSATVEGLDNVFHWCSGRPVVLRFQLFDRQVSRVEGSIVLYFQSNAVINSEKGAGQ